jgi:predicted N-acetyltransferase YhbS
MLLIRPERPEDTTAIRQVNEQAFGRSDEANLVDTLRTGGKAVLSLVGVERDRIVGHIFFSPVTDEDISVENLLAGRPSGESQRSLKRWLKERTPGCKQS